MLAEFDPLHDEGMQYIEKLRAAGVKVELIDYTEMVHCFIYLQAIVPQAHEAVAEAAKAVQRCTKAGPPRCRSIFRVKAMLDQMAAMAMPKLWEIGPQAARAAMRSGLFGGGNEPIGKGEDRTIKGPAGDIPVRVYTPVGCSRRRAAGTRFLPWRRLRDRRSGDA